MFIWNIQTLRPLKFNIYLLALHKFKFSGRLQKVLQEVLCWDRLSSKMELQSWLKYTRLWSNKMVNKVNTEFFFLIIFT